jgi:hypothetical protein
MSSLRLVAALGVAALVAGCGTNRPEIPDYLLEPAAGDSGASYPAGPYATDATPGKVVENFTFGEGWMDPKADNYDPAKLVPISFADFYDPDGSKGNELLLVNTAAFWCGACKNEHKGTATNPSLNQHYAELHPRGLAILSLIFQDNANNPASQKNLVDWATQYEETIPLARDPEYQMGRYGPSQSAPLNLIVDARNMKILHVYLGDQAAVIWPVIAQELAARGN